MPRDPKRYTCLYNPVTKKYELVLAIIPMPGDPDYKPFNIKKELEQLINTEKYLI